ncbi:hypothetical protein Pla111_03180 [Botrimarina hoheduenensis]|uniref:Uncharacterized protein n=1 Tax=Botrimarina hoheduenensis TaxID=2528000 RepID=A0A5C5WCA5_9BACT|nr:hypothetical protein Pla111_03180 [Botrimarina hoheduenensis]
MNTGPLSIGGGVADWLRSWVRRFYPFFFSHEESSYESA